MTDLNERMKKFCEVYVGNGGVASEAAKAAGYKGDSVRITGHKLLKLPKIQVEIERQLRIQMAQHGPVALKRIKELIDHEDPRIALKAAQDYADRAGLKPPEKKELTITDERTDQEIEASITSALAELGIDKVH